MTRRPIAQLNHALRSAVPLEGRRLAVFLDYDGTLTPIVDRPELAVLSDDARQAVRELAARLPVAVISGRDRADVERLVGVEGLIYAGSHGFDIHAPGLGTFAPEVIGNVVPLIDRAEAELHARLDAIPGALVERKRFTIAAHYRLVEPAEAPRVAEAVLAVLGGLPALRAKPGKKVFELQPAVDWHKGKAVLWLLSRLGLNSGDIVPLFIGDDVTDEDAFHSLLGRGVGIVVADPVGEPDRTSFAVYRLDDPGQVIELLRRL